MESKDAVDIRDQAMAAELLHAVAGKASEMIDKFSSWLLIGYGGAITFIISNADKLTNNVAPATLRYAVQALVPVTVLAIFAKTFAVIVGASSAGAAAGQAIGARWADSETPVNFRAVLKLISIAMLWPMRRFVERSFELALAGDLTSRALSIVRVGQWQALLTALQAICVLWAIIQLALHIRF